MALPTDRGVAPFYREYVHTPTHTASTVALTALGLLTVVHWAFAPAAIVAYLAPPLYLYLTGDGAESPPLSDAVGADTDAGEAAAAVERTTDDGRPSPSSPAEGVADRADGETADGTRDRWRAASVPTDNSLRDVAATAEGAYAVGDGGVVLARGADGWDRVVADGPAAEGNALVGVDATDDGRAAWVAGDGGAVGRLDATHGRLTDHSAPRDLTDNLTAVAVAGDAGAETVLLANGSGAVLRGKYDGERVAWTDPAKPGSGSSIAAVAATDGAAYCCDTNASVFVARDGGMSWSRLGVDDAGCAFAALAAPAGDRVLAAADDGRVFEYDGAVWTPRRVVDGALAGLAVAAREDGADRGVACGLEGTVAERTVDGWERRLVPTTADLAAAALGPDGWALVVGADGTVLERGRR